MEIARKIIIGTIVLIFLFNTANVGLVCAEEKIPAPIIISPNENTITGKVKPLITGLSESKTFVHVYIDGKYNGKTDLLNHPSGTANFSYEPFLNLSVGSHSVWAVAEDAQGKKSEPSQIMNFNIELPFPAPTLFAPVVNNKTSAQKPFIVGLAKNNAKIRVFIDHRLYGEFMVENHESGTANFAYLPFLGLTEGSHLVYTTSIDERGKESAWSNIVYFSVNPARQPKITVRAAEEKNDENETRVLGEELLPAEENGAAGIEEIEAIWKDKEDKKDARGGLLDESREGQGKLNLNLAIFLIFLAAIIGWIFWVNREIISEARARNKNEDNDKRQKNENT